MNLTSKSRYAMKIMMDLARPGEGMPVRRKDIVRRQGVPGKYLDQIMVSLRRGGLVESVRGRDGGYLLAKPAAAISIWDIFHCVESGLYPLRCVDDHDEDPCEFIGGCNTSDAWKFIFGAMKAPLVGINLAQLSAGFSDELKMCPAAGLRECAPGKAPVMAKVKGADL